MAPAPRYDNSSTLLTRHQHERGLAMNKTTPDEQRRHIRIPFDAEVRLCAAGTCWSGKLLDISLKGARTTLPADWVGQPGEYYLIQVLLDSEVAIEMEGKIAHLEADRIGFYCVHLDLDSMTHLKRLVELNLGDEEMLHRELSSLG